MFLLLVLWALLGVAAGIIMSNKGRSGIGGFLLGFLLGPIGLVIALVLQPDRKQVEVNAIEGGEMRKCPACAELIKSEAVKCRYCGTALQPA